MLTYSLNFFIVNKRSQTGTISAIERFYSHSAGDSFCCNYATNLCIYGIYASDNICCIFPGFQVLLSVTGMLVDLSVTIMQVIVSVAVMQLEVSAAHMQVTVSAASIQVTIFIVIMQMGVSVAVMQVVFSAVHYAHDCVYCNYAGDFPL